MTEQSEGRVQIGLLIGKLEIVIPAVVLWSPWVGLWTDECGRGCSGDSECRQTAVDQVSIIPLGCPGTLHHFAGSGHELLAPEPCQVNNLINAELRRHENLTPSVDGVKKTSCCIFFTSTIMEK